jgi:LytS/YehU family sensor histidine kinase
MFRAKNNLISKQWFNSIFMLIAIAIVLISTLFTNNLANKLATEERKRLVIWAEATHQFIDANENSDISFLSSIIEENTSIPVILTDNENRIISSKNIKEPESNVESFYNHEIKRLKESHKPIIVKIENTIQYIYYDESTLLKQLIYFPYIQFGIIIVFLVIAFFSFYSNVKAEQNQVWVGLSKETAHQLGTPISSLLAWMDILKEKQLHSELIEEMGKDMNRLNIIAERFSKIGSKPDLTTVDINNTLIQAVQYMIKRSSQQVIINCTNTSDKVVYTQLNIPLFEWVIENLCKNAIDAMNGKGYIDIKLSTNNQQILIDISDTGKGLEKNKFKLIFTPGFTTKTRGWGLGLSLVKRIIEEYHGGKIYVKSSEINKGTTFRIILKASIEKDNNLLQT